LLPTDIEANSESEVEKTAYELLALTDKISEAKPAFSLVMVDACRDNPLKSKGRNIGNARGLSAIEPPKGQMVVYSASRGQQALDRLSDKDPNPNGVFTREFITQMKKPGVRIEDIMRSVQDSVETLAKSVSHEQRPAVYNEARGNFYFFGPATLQVVANPVQVASDDRKDEKLLDDVKLMGSKEAFEAFINVSLWVCTPILLMLLYFRLSKTNKTTSALPANPSNNSLGDTETQQIYRNAKEQNDASAQVNLGNFYFTERGGLPKDDVQAEKYYRLAANQGNAQGQHNLGSFYSNGNGGLAKDDVQAEKYFRLSANQGDELA